MSKIKLEQYHARRRTPFIRRLLIIGIVFTLMMSVSIIAESSLTYDLKKYIRVGLKQYYENVNAISIYNQSLTIGYLENGSYLEEIVLESKAGYKVVPATSYLIISEQVFRTYEEALDKVKLLRKKGENASVLGQGYKQWLVTVDEISSKNEAEHKAAELSGIEGLSYRTYGDNGYRTKLIYDEGYPILFDNDEEHALFGTNEYIKGQHIIQLGKRSYRGKLEVGRYNEQGVTAINIVSLNEYLYGVLPSEMKPSWPKEALKAQAVAARNYAIYYTQVHKKYPNEAYEVCDTISSQVYKGFNVEDLRSNEAVTETDGKLIYYKDKIIISFFFSTSGGHTENSENVWQNSVPYLVGKPDLFEIEPEKKPWIQTYSSNDIQKALETRNIDIGTITNVEVTDYASSGRAMGLKIIGTKGSHILEKEKMRYVLGLNSRKFDLIKKDSEEAKEYIVVGANGNVQNISYDRAYTINGSGNIKKAVSEKQLIVVRATNIESVPLIKAVDDTYTFVGQGWGHGVGMSQSGAKGMALNGCDYIEILEYYYTGAVVR